MKKINANVIYIVSLIFLALFFLNNMLHKDEILDNVHYINDLTFVSYSTKEALKNNELPLWTPYFYSGHPLLAIPENYMFDLNFLLIFLLKNIYLAMNLSLIIYFFIAGLGMYLLVKELVKSRKAALVSAIIYMFNGLMHSFIISGHINILEGYSLVPFIFLFAHKALKSREWIFYSILAGIFLALQILSGSMILFFYSALIVSFYFAFSLISRNFASVLMKCVFAGAIIAAVALALSAVKLLPVLEFTKMSSRAVNVSFKEFLGNPVDLKDFAGIAVTNFGYGGLSAAIGVVGFILMIYGLTGYKKRVVIFSLALVIFSLLFASGTFIADLMYKMPGFGKLRHVERALVLFVFAGSILAAYGYILLSEKLKKFHAHARYERVFFAAIVFLILAEILLLQRFPLAAKVTQPNDIKLLEHMGEDSSTFRTMNIALNDVIGAAGYNYYSQKGISEVKGGGGIWVNDYAAFVSIAQQSLSPKILGILNVKYVISGKKLEVENLTLVDRFDICYECGLKEAFGPYLYKNEHFLPRYYFVPGGILVVGDDALARQLIYSLMFQNWQPGNSLIVKGTKINDYTADFLNNFDAIFLVREGADQGSIDKLRSYVSQGGKIIPDILNGQLNADSEEIAKIFGKAKEGYAEVNISQYSGNRVVLGLNGRKGWLVASERFAYFPGWSAKADGKFVDMFRANNAVTALYINGEGGELVFEYKPSSYGTGRIISIMSFIAIMFYFVYFLHKKKPIGDQNQN